VLRLGVFGLGLLGTSTVVAQFAPARSAPRTVAVRFTETYRGRRILGTSESADVTVVPRVYIDDVELHLMSVGRLGYSSQMNHYQTFATPLLAARAAVDSLNGATLLQFHR
jgi:hypothetical protein